MRENNYYRGLREVDALHTFWIDGHPATYSTKREPEWKARLFECLSGVESCRNEELYLRFILSTLAPRRQPLDIDNLCEPVFSTLVNKLGWFNGNRRNIHHWRATKETGRPSGLQLAIGSNGIDESLRTPDHSGIYNGPLPQSARDADFINWVKTALAPGYCRTAENFSVRILFGGNSINIADISSGRVKSILDCLYPILGGEEGSPEDWRINYLEIEKNVPSLKCNAVSILLWNHSTSVQPI